MPDGEHRNHPMKNPLLYLLSFVVLGVGAFGIRYLDLASSAYHLTSDPQGRTPALVSGIFCLVLAAGLLVFGIIAYRRRD